MKIYCEKSLIDFEPWSGAVNRYEALTWSELEELDLIIEEALQDENGFVNETTINDLFWFEPDSIAEWLGYDDWEDLEAHKDDRG